MFDLLYLNLDNLSANGTVSETSIRFELVDSENSPGATAGLLIASVTTGSMKITHLSIVTNHLNCQHQTFLSINKTHPMLLSLNEDIEIQHSRHTRR